MKRTTSILTISFTIIAALFMQPIDLISQASTKLSLDNKPEPLEATPFKFPKYDEFTMDNGLHVYVVENHQVPTVTFSLIFRGGDAFDPQKKEGVTALMADLMLKGTKYRSAQEIALTLDGVGASMSTSTSGQTVSMSGASLKKHAKLLFTILGEELTVPTFDDGELSKLREQYLAGVASQKSSATETAQALARKVIYGMDHPAARRQTEGSIQAITKDDILKAFSTYVVPNNASIAVVGDVTKDEVKKMLSEHLKGWKKGTVPNTTMPNAKTEPAGVYFVNRPGSVQSAVLVNAIAPGVEKPDWMAADVAMSYLGGGFGSRLFQTLREQYSYTYSPFGFVTRAAHNNRITLGAEVRSSVTDSALNVILDEVRKLGAEGPDPDVLERRIRQEVGQYRLLFERASTVGNLLQNVWTTGVPVEYVTKYDERLESISYGDVKNIGTKYLGMFDLRIVVVGAADVRSKLESFGQIKDFDLDLNPVVVAAYEKVDMSLNDIVEGYAKAIGGRAAIATVKTVSMTGAATMTMQGRPLKGTISRKLMVPNREMADIDLKMMRQTQWIDGQNAYVSMSGGPASAAPPDESKNMIADARTFQVLYWKEDGYQLTEAGKKGADLEVQVVNGNGRKELYVFDASTMLLKRMEREEETPQGPIVNISKYEDYKEVKGVKFPTKLTTQNSIYSMEYVWDVVVNEGVTEADFQPTKN